MTRGDLGAGYASSFLLLLLLSQSSAPLHLLFLGLGLWTGKRAVMGLGSARGWAGEVVGWLGFQKGFCGWEMTRVG